MEYLRLRIDCCRVAPSTAANIYKMPKVQILLLALLTTIISKLCQGHEFHVFQESDFFPTTSRQILPM